VVIFFLIRYSTLSFSKKIRSSGSEVFVSITGGSESFFFTEKPGNVVNIIKAEFEGYLFDAFARLDEHFGNALYLNFSDLVIYACAEIIFEFLIQAFS
jgi:hypothetical protein